MFRRSMVLLCALFLVVPLTGCETLSAILGNKPEKTSAGCAPFYAPTGAGFNFKGVAFPLGGTNQFKVGEAVWTPAQAAVLSDTILALDQNRQEQCAFLDAMQRAKPPATAVQIAQMYAVRADFLLKVDALKASLSASRPANEVIADAEKTKAAALKATVDLPKVVAEPPIAPEPAASSAMLDAALIRVATLESSVADLQGKLAKVTIASSRPATKTVTIDGFATGAVVADAAKREAALVELESVVNRFPAEQVPSMSIVGYADSEGAYAINVRLGLQRAKAVADLVSKSFAGRANIRSVTSGGVLDDRAEARRVEIVVSTRLMTSPRDQA